MEYFDDSVKLGLNKANKLWYNSESIRFVFKEIDPGELRTVIDQSKKITMACVGCGLVWTPYVAMDEIEWWSWKMVVWCKGQAMLFS